MVNISPKLKVLIAVAVIAIVGIIVAVVTVLVMQKTNVAKVQSLSFVDASVSINVGEEATLKVAIDPQNAKDKRLSFWSSDAGVIELVSVSENSVTIRAVSMGSATINVRSVKNKNLTDSCSVVVGDSVASGIECENSSSVVGEEKRVNITMYPESANVNKLFVSSFDNRHLEYAKIVVENGSAKLVYKAKQEGNSQVVLAVNAQTSNGDKVVLTYPVIITSVNPSIENVRYKVHSQMHASDVLDEDAGDVFIVDSNKGYALYFKLFGDNFQNDLTEQDALQVNYDSTLLEKSYSYINGSAYIKLVPKGDAGWSSVVEFSYAGVKKVVTIYNLNTTDYWNDVVVSLAATNIAGVYQLEVDSLYQINIESDFYNKLLVLGMAKLSVQSEFAQVSGAMLLATAKTDNLTSLAFVLEINYWDDALLITSKTEKVVRVEIKEVDFTEM